MTTSSPRSRQPSGTPVGGQFAPGARPAAAVALTVDDPMAVTEQGTTVGDPADLASGSGVRISSHWREVEANHFYYGMGLMGGRSLVGGRPLEVARWVTSAIEGTGGQAETFVAARRLWERRGEISAVVLRHGGNARIRVQVGAESITVSDYDYSKWSEELTGGLGDLTPTAQDVPPLVDALTDSELSFEDDGHSLVIRPRRDRSGRDADAVVVEPDGRGGIQVRDEGYYDVATADVEEVRQRLLTMERPYGPGTSDDDVVTADQVATIFMAHAQRSLHAR